MRESLHDYCIRNGREELLAQWLADQNGGMTPRTISYGSKVKVWWQCEKGHRWQAAVYTRAGGGSGCPYCAGLRPNPGETDLATQYPALAAEWHPTKNGLLTPSDVIAGSHKRVWWRCPKGHEWSSAIKTRTQGCGCPVCAHRQVLAGENDLAATHPALAAEWHPTLNGPLTPADVVAGNRRKVWWKCAMGHEWQASIASRSTGVGCPVCAGRKVVPGENDLASQFPEVAAQWDHEKNGALTPEGVSPYSNRRVWWVCEKGHGWPAQIMARTGSGSGCPYCAGRKVLPGFNDLASQEPEIAAQWHPDLNGALTPDMVTVGSHKKVWWQCPSGHVWKAVVYSRGRGRKCGCPVCAGVVSDRRQRRYQAGQVNLGKLALNQETTAAG